MSFLGAASELVMPHVFPDGARESGVFADVRSVEEVGGLSGYAGGAGEFQSAMRCSAFARAFAEYARIEVRNLVLKPASLTFEQAAAVSIAATTALWGILEVGQVRAGHRVLVNGAAGGVGTYAVQIAAALGAEVAGVSGTGPGPDLTSGAVRNYGNVSFGSVSARGSAEPS